LQAARQLSRAFGEKIIIGAEDGTASLLTAQGYSAVALARSSSGLLEIPAQVGGK
jgi:hypothetical protein